MQYEAELTLSREDVSPWRVIVWSEYNNLAGVRQSKILED